MVNIKERNELVAAALRLAAAERGGLDGRDALDEVSRASDRLDMAARRYVEVIGPLVYEHPEPPVSRHYGQAVVADAEEEE